MAIVVLLNLGIVLFDLTYVPLRNFWLLGNVKLLNLKIPVPLPPPIAQPLPAPIDWLCRPVGQVPEKSTLITQCYDPVKGIEANRDTEIYLTTVSRLEDLVTNKGRKSLDAPTDPEVLATLQTLGQFSADLVSANPFALADKSGTLEKIKNLMRDRMEQEIKALSDAELQQLFQQFENRTSRPQTIAAPAYRHKVSATAAFLLFWSPAHLNAGNWQREIGWFNAQIRPLMQTNYFRSISENGLPINNFWAIDAPFVALFLLEFLARTFYLSRRSTGISWFGAMVWRWYDLPLIFPFGLLLTGWAWLRVLPAIVRIHQSELLDLHQLRDSATQGFVSSIAEEITEVVIVQVIDQTQAAIRRGDFTQLLAQVTKARVDINNVDEVAEIASLLVNLSVYQVFPQVQPDVEALLRHTIDSALNQAPAYQALKQLPGMATLSAQLNDRIAKEVVQTSYQTVTGALQDPIGTELTKRLIYRLGLTIQQEIQQQKILPELQSLLTDLLEEIKLSYVQGSTEVNSALLMEETRQLRQIAKGR